jgi:hypothetical protein
MMGDHTSSLQQADKERQSARTRCSRMYGWMVCLWFVLKIGPNHSSQPASIYSRRGKDIHASKVFFAPGSLHCSFHFTLPPRQQQVEQTRGQDPPAFHSFISNQRRRLPFGNPDYIISSHGVVAHGGMSWSTSPSTGTCIPRTLQLPNNQTRTPCEPKSIVSSPIRSSQSTQA